jgi:tetratricopeptide (TPR) repeat protein
VQVALGDLFFARKEYGRASAYFDAAIRLDESHARSWFRRGLSRFYRKEFAPAVEDMERAKKLDPLLPSVDTFIDRARRRQL